MTRLAEQFEKLNPPSHIRSLPCDSRGFPVPWFVTWLDEKNHPTRNGRGRPDFRVVTTDRPRIAHLRRVCWICGLRLGRMKTFVIGPMCAVNHISSEPPSHLECARFAAQACPFLAFPNRKRNDGDIEHLKANVPGQMIERNPGVTLLWTCTDYIYQRNKLFQIGEPVAVEWWAKGRAATRDEVLHSITTGMPALEAYCFTQEDRDELVRRRAAADKLLPAAAEAAE